MRLLTIHDNKPRYRIIDVFGRRVLFRRYARHTYLWVLGRVIFDWWPNDVGDRLRIFNRRVLK